MSHWDDAPLAFRVEDHCPDCLSVDKKHIRTPAGGDGSRARRYVCRACGTRFVIVINPPQKTIAQVGQSGSDECLHFIYQEGSNVRTRNIASHHPSRWPTS